MSTPAEHPTRSRLKRITGSFWFNLVAAVVVLALVQAFVVKLYYVPSGSMESTLEIGDRILVNRVEYRFSDPQSGQIIVFNASEAWEESTPAPTNPISYVVRWLGGVVGIGPNLDHTLVKRIIAGPGQTVVCCSPEGAVMVDGQPLDEPYIFEDLPFVAGSLDCDTTPMSRRCFGEFVVPDDRYFVLGDHRSNSADSVSGCRGGPVTDQCVKLVARDDIVGRAFSVVLPPGRWRSL